MRIRTISVERLFGLFDHRIPLGLQERITIIHGPNGFGKTFILKMVAGLLSGNYAIFRKVPFATFSLEFDDGRTLRVERQEPDPTTKNESEAVKPTLEAVLNSPGEDSKRCHLDRLDWSRNRGARAEFINFIEQNTPLSRIAPGVWVEPRTGRQLSFDDVFERYGQILPMRPEMLRNEDEWLKQLREAIPVRFIQTQRLDTFTPDAGRRGEPALVPTVKNYSDELTKDLQSVLARYAKRASELDSTFPERLFRQDFSNDLPAADLRQRLVDLEQKRSKLNELGFLDPEQGLSQPPEHALERNRNVLTVYVGDVARKLSVFDELAAKIDLFTTTVNSRFRYKRLSINRDRGFVFTSETGMQLNAADLSSGEQHELVLLYELLFKLSPNSLVLIDEPEISLHIVWQQQFLDDLQKMVELSKFDVIVATHSPELIGEHWDLAVGLDGPRS